MAGSHGLGGGLALATQAVMDQRTLHSMCDHQVARTPLQRIIAEHLDAFLESGARGRLPGYIEQALRAHLACGVAKRGVVRVRCRECGHVCLVAISCGAGCQACHVRRVRDTTDHLADCVVGDRPARHWVLSVPPSLRLRLACDADEYRALARIFVEELLRWQCRRAEEQGIAGTRGGALSFQQRFGDSLNLNCHLHVVAFDGVFAAAPTGDGVTFHSIRAPGAVDLEQVVLDTRERMALWVAGRQHAGDDATTMMASIFMQNAAAGDVRRQVPFEPRDGRAARAGTVGSGAGYNLHAGVRVAAADRAGRKRLLGYCARPALDPERLSLLPDGRVVYRLRHRAPGDAGHRVMTPPQLLTRLAALAAPPQQPLLHYHGVLAPRATWRSAIVREPRRAEQLVLTPEGSPACARPRADDPASARSQLPSAAPTRDRASAPDVELVDGLVCVCGGPLEVIDDTAA